MSAPVNSQVVDVRGARRGVTYTVAPAAQHVVGGGVLRLQLDGFIQMILEGEAGRQTDGFHC